MSKKKLSIVILFLVMLITALAAASGQAGAETYASADITGTTINYYNAGVLAKTETLGTTANTVTGNVTVNGTSGTVTIPANLTIQGTTIVASGVDLTVSGSAAGTIQTAKGVSVSSGASVSNDSTSATISGVGSDGVTVSSTGATSSVKNAGAGSAISGVAGSVNVQTGGDVESAGSSATITGVTGAVQVAGGAVSNTGTGSAVTDVSGGVSVTSGTVTSKNTTATITDVKAGGVTVSGGTVSNTSTGTGSAISNVTGGINVTGGTVTTSGTSATIDNIGATGDLNISGGAVTNTNTTGGSAVKNINGAVNVSGGTVSNNSAAAAIDGTTTGDVTVSNGASVTNNGSGAAITKSSGNVTVTGSTTNVSSKSGTAIVATGDAEVSVTDATVSGGNGTAISSVKAVTLNNAKVKGGVSTGSDVVLNPGAVIDTTSYDASAVNGAKSLTANGTGTDAASVVTIESKSTSATVNNIANDVKLAYTNVSNASGDAIANTGGSVSLTGVSKVTSTAGNGITGTKGSVAIGDSTHASSVTGGINGVSDTTGNVTVNSGSSVTGTTGAAITGTAGTDGVTINSATISGDKGGIVDTTNGSVVINGTSTINGGKDAGIKTTAKNVTIGDGANSAAITGATGISATSGDVTVNAGSSVTGTTGAAIADTRGVNGVTINNATITGANGGIIDTTNGSVMINGTSTVNGGTGAGIGNTAKNVTVGDGTNKSTVTGATGVSVTNGNVTVNATSTVAGINGAGITSTGGSVTVAKQAEVKSNTAAAITNTTANVTIADDAAITGANGGITETGGYVQVGTNVTIKGGTGSAIDGTKGGNVSVNQSGSKQTTLTGASGITNTKGSVLAKNTDIIATDGSGISNTSGNVEFTGTSSINATSGDGITKTTGNVTVGDGTNTVTVISDKTAISATTGSVTVKGNDKTKTIISGNTGGVTNVSGDVAISNATVNGGSGDAIQANAGNNNDVSVTNSNVNTDVAGSGNGIVADGRKDVSVTDTIINVGGNGVMADKSSSLTVKGSDPTKMTITTASGDAVAAENVQGNVSVTNATIVAGKGSGVNVKNAADNTVISNTVISNVSISADVNGIDASNTKGTLDISDVAVTAGKNGINASGNGTDGIATITNVKVMANDGYGIDVSGKSGATISGVDVTAKGANGTGIVASGDTNLTIETKTDRNTISADKTGIDATNGTTAKIVSNTQQPADTLYIQSGKTQEKGYGLNSSGGSVVTSDVNLDIKTTTNGSNGLNADGGSIVENKNVVISTTGKNANGIVASGDKGLVAVSGTTNITTVSADANGIVAEKGGDVKTVGATNIKTSAANAKGVYVTGAGSTYAASDDLTITTSGDSAYGINGIDGGAVTVKGKTTIETTGASANGIVAEKGGDVKTVGATNIKTSAASAKGIYVTGAGSTYAASDDLTITTSGDSAYGINGTDGGAVTVKGKTTIETSGVGADGVYLSLSNSSYAASGDVVIHTTNSYANGIYAISSSDVDIDGKAKITLENSNGNSGAEGYGIGAVKAYNSKVNLNGGAAISASGSDTLFGIDAENKSVVTTSGDTTISVKATGYGYGVYAAYNSTVSGDVTSIDVTAENKAFGIQAKRDSSVDLSMNGDITAKSTAKDAFGIQNTSSDVKVDGVKNIAVSTEGTGATAYGIDTYDGGATVVSMDGDLKSTALATGSGAYGVKANNSVTTVTVTGANNLEVSADKTAAGVQAENGSSAYVAVSGDVKVESVNGEAYGTKADGQGAATTLAGAENVTVKAGGGNAYGVFAKNNGVASGDVENITVTAPSDREADGIYIVNSTGDVAVKTITASGDRADAIDSLGGSNTSVTGLEKVDVKGGSHAAGFVAQGDNGSSGSSLNVVMSGDVNEIDVESISGPALGVYAWKTGSADIAMSGDMKVKSDKGNAYGLRAKSSDITLTGAQSMMVSADSGSAYGALSESGSNVNAALSGDMTVTSASNGKAYGIVASSDSKETITGLQNLKVTASDDLATGIEALNGSSADVTMSGDVTVSTKKGNATGIDAQTSSDVTFNGVKAMTVSTDNGDAYGIYADNKSTVSGDLTSMKVTASGFAEGISAVRSSDVKLAMSGDLSVESKNYNAYGIDAQTSSDVTFTGMKAMTVSGDGGGATGINAHDNSTVSGDLTSMKVYGVGGDAGSNGISASSSDVKLAMSGDLSVESKNGTAHGIDAETSSNVTFTGMKAMTVSGDFGWAQGIYALDNSTVSGDVQNIAATNASGSATGISAVSSSDVKLAMSGDLSVESKNGTAYGIDAETSSDVTFTGMQAMTVSGDVGDASGISAYDNSTVSGDLTSMTVYSVGGAGSDGILASSSDVKLAMSGDLSVESKNYNAHGIDARKSSDVTFTGMQAMTVSGDDASGVYADNSTVSGDLTSMTVTASGNHLFAEGIDASSSDVKLVMSGDLSVESKNGTAYGISARTSSDVTFTGMKAMTVSSDGGDAYGILASNNSTVSGDLTSMKVTASELAEGIIAVDSSDVTLTGTTSVVAAGATKSNAIDSKYNSVVSLEDDLDKLIAVSTDKSGANASVLKVSNSGKIRLNKATVKNLGSGAANSITAGLDLNGNMTEGSGVVDVTASSLSGDVEQAGKSGTLEVLLKNKSFLSGAAKVTSGDGAISINVEGAGQTTGNNKDNGSVWEVTGDSDMKGSNTTLSSVLNNTGVVSFDHEAGGNYKVISTDQLTGQNGLYLMNTNIDNASGWVNGRQADQVRTVSGDASGVLAISNNDANVAAFESLMTTPLVYVASGDHDNTNFTLMSKQGDKYYELGAWKYDLEKIVNPDGSVGWYLVNHDLSAVSHAALNAVMMPDVWYLETNALFSQLGDYNVSRDDVSVWGYAVYNKLRVDNAIKFNGAAAAANFTLPEENEVEHVFRGLTGGIDKRLASDDNKQVFGGLMIGYGEGDYDFNYGDADDNSFHVGLYGVWRFSSGWYLAGLVKYNRYKTNLTANPYGGGSYSTDYTQNGFGVSAMAGRQFVNESGWFWEPQVELGWHHIGGADYTLSGMPVEIEGANSLRGRVGIGFGKKYVREDGSTLDLFVKASLVHEFDGETDVNLYTDANKTAYDPLTVDYGGTWGQYKAGVNYNSGKDFNAHAAVTYEKGGDRESPIGFEVGLTWLTGPKAKARAEERKALEEEKKAAEEERLAAEEAERKAKDMAEREEKAKIAAEATIKEQKIEAQKKALEEKQARETVQEMTPAQKSELAKMAKELHMTVEQLANVMLETMKSILEKQGLLQK